MIETRIYTIEKFIHYYCPHPVWTPPVRPVTLTGQTGLHGPTLDYRSDRSWQNRGAARSAHKGATRQLSSLGVSLHHLPPLCIPADEHDTAGAEVDVWVSWNIFLCGNKPWATNTPQDLPDQWVYLAHIPRHVRYLAGGLFCRKATKVIPYFQLLAPYSICLNRQLVFASSKAP